MSTDKKSTAGFGECFFANRTQGMRAVGGKLIVSESKITFRPNWIEFHLGGMGIEIEIASIKSVVLVDAKYSILNIFSGGWRKRLAIFTLSNNIEYFVLNNPKYVLERIETHLRGIA